MPQQDLGAARFLFLIKYHGDASGIHNDQEKVHYLTKILSIFVSFWRPCTKNKTFSCNRSHSSDSLPVSHPTRSPTTSNQLPLLNTSASSQPPVNIRAPLPPRLSEADSLPSAHIPGALTTLPFPSSPTPAAAGYTVTSVHLFGIYHHHLTDDYKVRIDILGQLQRNANTWFELALSRAPTELQSTLQKYLAATQPLIGADAAELGASVAETFAKASGLVHRQLSSLCSLSDWKFDRARALVSPLGSKCYFSGEVVGLRLATRKNQDSLDKVAPQMQCTGVQPFKDKMADTTNDTWNKRSSLTVQDLKRPLFRCAVILISLEKCDYTLLVFRGMILPGNFHSIVYDFPYLHDVAVVHCTVPFVRAPPDIDHTSLKIETLTLLDIHATSRSDDDDMNIPRTCLRLLAKASTLRTLTYDHTVWFPVRKGCPRIPLGFISFLETLPPIRTLIMRNHVPALLLSSSALPVLCAVSAPSSAMTSLSFGCSIVKLDIRDEAMLAPLYIAEVHSRLSRAQELSFYKSGMQGEHQARTPSSAWAPAHEDTAYGAPGIDDTHSQSMHAIDPDTDTNSMGFPSGRRAKSAWLPSSRSVLTKLSIIWSTIATLNPSSKSRKS
ncbi:hypothetical protein P692DRAFT_201872422 [Suillus brevipes Sb2]|nr:hypothetical protein P692DRAFT_201872422 [Suillus brevipes Sb2]